MRKNKPAKVALNMIATNQKVLIEWGEIIWLIGDDDDDGVDVEDDDEEDELKSVFWVNLMFKPDDDDWFLKRLPVGWPLVVDIVNDVDNDDDEGVGDEDVDADTSDVLMMIKIMGHIKLGLRWFTENNWLIINVIDDLR